MGVLHIPGAMYRIGGVDFDKLVEYLKHNPDKFQPHMFGKMGLEEDEAIEAGMITKQIENAQKKVEGRNFSIRKNVLKYDDVMNVQREIIYKQRNL